MADKKTFFNSINQETVFSEEFYKKVYGYSVYDNNFLTSVAAKLIELKRKDVVQAYNQWLMGYTEEHNKAMKGIADWYIKQHSKKRQEKIDDAERTKIWKSILDKDLLQKSDRELLKLLEQLKLNHIA